MSDYIDFLLANANKPSVGEQKMAEVAQTSAAKKAEMAPALTAQQMYAAVAGNATGAGNQSATQGELDARYMSPTQVWDKYGFNDQSNDMITKRAAAGNQVATDLGMNRDWSQAAADTVSGVGLGAFNGLAGIGAMAAGVVSPSAGAGMAKWVNDVNTQVMESQSPALQGRRKVNQALDFNDQRDSTAQFNQDIADGASGFGAGARRIGRDVISSIGNAVSDPMTALDGTAQAYGSLVGIGPISRVGAAVNSKAILSARNAGVLTKEQARNMAKLAEGGGTAALIGSMEAGGAFQQTANQVLEMDFDTLRQNSPDFNKLVMEGMDPAEARTVLANKSGLAAAAITAPAAVAMGKFVAKFEAAPMTTASMTASLANIGKETIEEAVQGGASQMAGNAAIGRYANQNQTLSEGVGQQIGTGALFGGLMAGGVQAPGLAALGAGKAVNAVLDAVPNKTAAPAATPAATPKSNSPVQFSTDLNQTAKEASAIAPAAETLMPAATESIMQNPALDEGTKAAQVSSLESLQTAFAYDPAEFAVANQSGQIPASLGSALETSNNLPDAVSKVTSNVLEQAKKLDTPESIQGFITSVAYMDDLLDRAENLAARGDVDAIMSSMTEGSPEAAYLSGIFQAFANIEGSQQIDQARKAIAQSLGKRPPLQSVNPDTAPEVMVRAKYAPHTLSSDVVSNTLAMAEAGQIEITPMQRISLQGAKALTEAMMLSDSTDAVDAVTRQVAFSGEGEADAGKYPSLAEHTNRIMRTLASGNTPLAEENMAQLRNFAETLSNKNNAISSYLNNPKQGRQKYQNWIPTAGTWRESATGLDANLAAAKSRGFANRVFVEAATAAATYNNLLEQFPALGGTPLAMPTMNSKLSRALSANSTSAQGKPSPAPKAAPAAPAAGTGAVEADGEGGEFSDLFDEQGRARFSNASSVKEFKKRTGLGQDGVRAIQAAVQDGRPITLDEARQADIAGQERRNASLEQSKAESEAESRMAKENAAKPAEQRKLLGDYEIPGLEGGINRVRVFQQGTRIEAVGLGNDTANNDLSRLVQSGQTVEQALATLYGDHGPNEAPNPSRVKRIGQPNQAKQSNAQPAQTGAAPAPAPVAEPEAETPQNVEPAVEKTAQPAIKTEAKVELKTEPTPAAETPQKEAATAVEPAVTGTETVATPEAAPAEPETAQAAALKNLLPGVNQTENELTKHFNFKPRSKTQEMAEPFFDVQAALETDADLEKAAGKRIPSDLRKKAKAYMDGFVGPILGTVYAMFQENLSAPQHGWEGTRGEFIAAATEDASGIRKPVQLQAGNKGAFTALLQRGENGAVELEPHLIQAAAVAVGEWFLSAGGTGAHKMSEAQVAKYVGISTDQVTPKLQTLISMGIGDQDAVRGMGDKIQAAWGASIKDDAPLARAQSIPLGLAANFFHAMLHGKDPKKKAFFDKFFIVKEIRVDANGKVLAAYDLNGPKAVKTIPSLPDTAKTIRRYIPQALPDEVRGAGPVLSRITGLQTEDNTYFDPADLEVSKTQLRSNVPLTAAEKSAQEAQQKTPHRINEPFLKLLRALSPENMVELLGSMVFDGMNEKARESAEGKNVSVLGGFNQAMATVARIEAEAAIQGVNPVDIPTFYKYETTSTNRSMMQGKYNPQSDKTVRNLIMPQEARLDLTKADERLLWDTASIQMIGERTYAMTDAQITARAEQIFSHPAVGELQVLLEDVLSGKEVDGASLVQAFKNAAEATDQNGPVVADGMTNEFMHVMLDRARLSMNPEKANDFTSKLYLEADGVANGPAGAMAMLGLASLDGPVEYVRKMRKVGVFIGHNDMNMAQHRQVDGVDAYAETGKNTAEILAKSMKDRYGAKDTPVKRQHLLFNQLVTKLYPGGAITFDVDANGNTTVNIKRGATKNPMTVTVYGSGAAGIASKIAGILTDELASIITTAQLTDDYSHLADVRSLLTPMVHNKPYWKNKVLNLFVPKVIPPFMEKAKLKEFELTSAQFETLQANVREFLVNDMVRGIETTVGSSVMQASKAMVAATSLQALVLQNAFTKAMAKIVADRKAADPEWREDLDGLSKNDLKKLDKELEFLRPLLRTTNQTWDVSGSQRSTGTGDISSSMFGSYGAPMTFYQPGPAGVKVAPYLVIGMGDAQMVQNLFNEWTGRGILQVFDGINLGLNDVKSGGPVVNKAMADAWFDNNPVKTVAESFNTTVELGDIEGTLNALKDADPDQYEKVVKSLDDWGGAEGLLDWLRNTGKEVDIQHEAIRELGFTADQMAATGMPFVSPGSMATPTYTTAEGATESAAAIADQLQAAIEKRRGKKVAQSTIADLTADAPKDQHGNTVLSFRGLRGLLRHMKMDAGMRSLVQEALTTNATALKDMKVVIGSTESLLAGGYDFGHESTRTSLENKAVRGLWDESSKTLVLAPGYDTTTLPHEILHAATLSALTNAYLDEVPNGKVGEAMRNAALEIERMLLQFMSLTPNDFQNLSKDAKREVSTLVRVIRNVTGTPEGTPVVEHWNRAEPGDRIQAMNEFMVHVLTGTKLREITRFQKFKAAVLNFVRRVIFGDRDMKVGNDLFSQLEFQTRVLMRTREQLAKNGIREMMQGSTLESRTFATDDRATELAGAFQSIVGDYLVERPDLLSKVTRLGEYTEAGQTAADLTVAAESVGFLGSPVQRDAFVRMVSVLNTQAKVEPLVMQEVQRLYKSVAGQLNTSMGLSQQQVDLLLGRSGITIDGMGRSSLVPLFFALGLIDPTMSAALAKIKAPADKYGYGSNFDEKLQGLGNNLLSRLQEYVVSSDNSAGVDNALAALANTVIEQSRKEENLVTAVDKKGMGLLNRGNDWVADALAKGSTKLGAKATQVAAASKSKAVKTAAAAVAVTSNVFNDAGAAANAEAMLTLANTKSLPEAISSIIKDLTGRVASNANVYDLIKRASHVVSKARQFYKEQLPSTLQATFKTKPTDEQWTHMFKGMAKTEVASLVQSMGVDKALTMVTDAAARRKEIGALEKAIKAEAPSTYGRVYKKAHQLANYMTTGVAGPALLRNAAAVANLLGDRASGLGARGVAAKSQNYVDMVDRLISLYALDVQPKDTVDAIADLVTNEPDAMKQLLSVMQQQHEKDMARRSGSAVFNAYKGYIPSDGVAGASLLVADVRDTTNLRRKGYVQVADYVGTKLFQSSKMAYFYTPVGKAPFNQGIIQNARMTSGGVDIGTGFTSGVPTAGRITQSATVDRLAKNMHLDTAREALLPIWDNNGNIVAFERSIDPDQLQRLRPSTHLAAMLGQWMGRQAEEELAQGVNFDAVAKVHQMYVQAGARQNEFVNVLDDTQFKDDPVMRDALRLIPPDVRAQAQNLFGTGKFMVRKDMLNDVFGYRDASIGDAWTGNSRWSPETQARVRRLAETFMGQDAYRILVQNEDRWKNLVKDAKTLIVVKSVVVPAANFVANIFQMLARGVPLSTIIKGLRNKTLETDQYVKSNVERMELQVRLMAAGNDRALREKLEAQIQAIEDSWKRLSIWPLIDAGEFGSISDAGISRDEILLTEGRLQAYIEAKTDKLPPAVRSLGKNLLLTKDTALFQGLQKSMEYGDFLAKAIVYEHELQKGTKHEDALGIITDEFVNYDRLPGRTRGTLENYGLAWFYNYKLRIAKTAFSMIRKDPLRVALLAGMGLPGMELPVTENVFTKGIEGTLGYSLGPGMLFNAPGMNPWSAALQ